MICSTRTRRTNLHQGGGRGIRKDVAPCHLGIGALPAGGGEVQRDAVEELHGHGSRSLWRSVKVMVKRRGVIFRPLLVNPSNKSTGRRKHLGAPVSFSVIACPQIWQCVPRKDWKAEFLLQRLVADIGGLHEQHVDQCAPDRRRLCSGFP